MPEERAGAQEDPGKENPGSPLARTGGGEARPTPRGVEVTRDAVVFRGLGHVSDAMRRVVPFETVFTAEAMQALTLVRPTDDSAVHADLGIAYRDPAESIEASLRALHAGGWLDAKHVGLLATG